MTHHMVGRKHNWKGGRDQIINIRCTAEQKQKWKREAEHHGLNLSDYIHQTLDGTQFEKPKERFTND